VGAFSFNNLTQIMTTLDNTTKTLKTFYYKNELYIRLIPAKSLFNSTMVHQVVNRGDVFAMKVSDQTMTIIPGKADVIHSAMDVIEPLTWNIQQPELPF
jgi:hypothetical protein